MQDTLLYAARKVTLKEAEQVIVSLAAKVETLTASQNKCGSGAGCLYKEALIDSLTEERDALARTKASDQAAYIAMRDQRDEALKLAADRLVDAERLDWVLAHRNHRVQGNDARGWYVMDCSNGLTFVVRDAKTSRLAIDAAMQSAKEAR